MSRIRSRNTSPEMIVRRTVHKMGYRYRLHVTELPGKPDLVFPKLRRIIEVRGCFWHQHACCIDSHIPKSRRGYWLPKLKANLRRDKENGLKLRNLGWRLLVIWECELGDSQQVSRRLATFLAE